jgi:hypothetical protein
MSIESWRLFDRLQQEGVIPAGVKFQISLPTPIAPTYNSMVPTGRPALAGLQLRPETELYLGLVHRDDMAGNAARLAAARSYVRVDGIATECGMARGDPARFPELLAAHAKTAELAPG